MKLLFSNIFSTVDDLLTPAKLSFFSFLASHLEPYLVKYQTDWPMMPFMYDELTLMCRKLLDLVVKGNVISQADTGLQLNKIDLSKSQNLQKDNEIQIRFAA